MPSGSRRHFERFAVAFAGALPGEKGGGKVEPGLLDDGHFRVGGAALLKLIEETVGNAGTHDHQLLPPVTPRLFPDLTDLAAVEFLGPILF